MSIWMEAFGPWNKTIGATFCVECEFQVDHTEFLHLNHQHLRETKHDPYEHCWGGVRDMFGGNFWGNLSAVWGRFLASCWGDMFGTGFAGLSANQDEKDETS